ncbi:unnamed protein product [Acanthosepion pharaonis]|uniref:DUF7041 domain-containing protein n=1 Tax=Acanthosepion pharaonis TaxID=158019 RepID=A0A812B219_ACAPH|nr:unnamed protein product [Sepia pharaonis]
MADQSAQETAVVLTLPTFDMTNINVWFAQTEAIFQAKHIHSQTARYAYIVEKLPPEIAADVLDLLEAVPAHNPFDKGSHHLPRNYQWIFTIADVKFPILGAGFLAHYQLIVDLSQRQLSDSTTKLSNRGIISQLTSTELRIAVPRDNSIQDILDKFPSLIQPFTYTEPVKHSTLRRIRTTEQPVYSKPRRLAPDKYKIARAEFQHMLDLEIIRPSSSPYASPLHMVTKAQQGTWGPCGDYRRLNSQTVPDKLTTADRPSIDRLKPACIERDGSTNQPTSPSLDSPQLSSPAPARTASGRTVHWQNFHYILKTLSSLTFQS